MCCGCSACASACPVNCISMEKNAEGFLYPQIATNHCIHCGRCKAVCPVLNSTSAVESKNNEYPIAWAAIAKDNKIQANSSSGGIFSLLAENMIASGGVVYGAAFTDDFHKVHHIGIENIEQLNRLRTSKYLQSEMDDTFINIKEHLKAGRKVLFTGTPCQVAGLRSYLGEKYYTNLFCAAVICHGVPSSKLWGVYLEYLSKKYNGRIISVNFRYKKQGKELKRSKNERDRKIYYRGQSEEPYMHMFLRDLCLRESCYHCSAKENGSGADITIADFWGIENVAPEMASSMGTSLAIAYTEKGKHLMNSILEQAQVKKVDFKQSILDNPSYNTSMKRPEMRTAFYDDLERMPWKYFEKKYCYIPPYKRIRNKLGKIKKAIKTRCLNSSEVVTQRMIYGLNIEFEKTKK